MLLQGNAAIQVNQHSHPFDFIHTIVGHWKIQIKVVIKGICKRRNKNKASHQIVLPKREYTVRHRNKRLLFCSDFIHIN